MSLILGLNAFHPDSAACALVDGKLVAAVAEERLGLGTSMSFFVDAIRSISERVYFGPTANWAVREHVALNPIPP